MSAFVGREPELAAVEELLSSGGSGLRALEIVGEPGIGKTALCREAERRAQESGGPVLVARPAAAEAKLAFAGLTDLLGGLQEDVLDALPSPQRHALDVVLLRAESARPPQARVIGTAIVSVLRDLAARESLVVIVDDAHWLDAPSAAALEFAVRRLDGVDLRLLASRRADAAEPQFLAQCEPRKVVLGPLSVAAVQRIIAERLDVNFPRPVLVRITEASRGNPFHALQIARLLVERDVGNWALPLPVPDDLRALVGERIAALPDETRHALLRAAALTQPDSSLVDLAALGAAEQAGLVSVGAGGGVEFTHPLFASAVYGSVGEGERRALHRSLAAEVGAGEERARHLALAAVGPDENAAGLVQEAARDARARGAAATAAELAELAVELTPPGNELLAERELELASHLYLAGDFERAASVARVLAGEAEGDLRAHALLLLADVVYWRAGESAAVVHAEAALSTARDPLLQARCHVSIAMHAGTSDLAKAAAAARAALELLDKQPGADPALASLALSARVRADLFLGHGLDRDAAARALELEGDSPPAAVDTRVAFKLGQWLRYVDDLAGARAHLAAVERQAVDEGDESSLANILLNRSLLECWSGNWEEAAAVADRSGDLFTLTGTPAASSTIWRAYVDAHAGRVGAVRAASAARGVNEEPVVRMLWERTLGLAELSLGDVRAADRHFAAAVDALADTGFREPAVWRIHGDAIEASVDVGDLERAERLLGPLEAAAEQTRIPWTLAVSARCRGLVHAAAGEAEDAERMLEQALRAHEQCPVPFELARTLFAEGKVLRRAKQKLRARTALDQAVTIFDALGAETWAERAREERERTAVRSALEGLSPTELRIAQLAADGLTNDAIAAEVFVTRKTVEANLGRAYRKLGIRSRAQLARALDSEEQV